MTVLDTSALLAYLYAEPGHETVAAHLDDGVLCAVNWSEALQKIAAAGGDADRLSTGLIALGVRVEPFGADDARTAAALWPHTRAHGLSLGDRACLALARRHDVAVLTADKAWAKLNLEVDVQLIR